jgi:hypothetical protein
MAGFRHFCSFVRNAPRGALADFLEANVLLVKHFSKSGHAKMGGITLSGTICF